MSLSVTQKLIRHERLIRCLLALRCENWSRVHNVIQEHVLLKVLGKLCFRSHRLHLKGLKLILLTIEKET